MKCKILFILFIHFFCSCNEYKNNINNKKLNDSITVIEPNIKSKQKRTYNYNDTVKFPWRTETDTGYFKGFEAENISPIPFLTEDTNSFSLNGFINRNIYRNEIKFLNTETLSHSVFINQKTKTRFDTLGNKNINFISVYKFGDVASQKIYCNGKIIQNYNPKGNESSLADIIFFDERSFRLFSFKGKKYCYFDGNIPYTGGSVDNVCLQLIYSFQSNKLFSFYSCRYPSAMLFGDVDGDDNLDYLNFDNSDFCTTVPGSDRATFRLFSVNKVGDFIERKDKKKNPFIIDGNTGSLYLQDSFKITNYNWPVPIK